jgi:hypothetical protein
MFEPTTGASGTVGHHPPMQDDDLETVEGDERDTSGDVFDDDDPEAPNLVPETGPALAGAPREGSSCVSSSARAGWARSSSASTCGSSAMSR